MTTTAFSRDVRILVCDGCGAPLAAPNQGGASTCRFCHATTMFAARAEAPIAPAQPAQMTEAQRLWQLRAQDAQPLRGPSTLPLSLLTWHGDNNPKKYAEALAEWTRARLAIIQHRAAPRDEDHVYFLTLTISNYLSKTKEQEKLRATLESAVEACQKPLHRQALYCMLTRMAAKMGDVQAAEAWLAPCDPRSANIHMDSEYRFANAYLDLCPRGVQGLGVATSSAVPGCSSGPFDVTTTSASVHVMEYGWPHGSRPSPSGDSIPSLTRSSCRGQRSSPCWSSQSSTAERMLAPSAWAFAMRALPSGPGRGWAGGASSCFFGKASVAVGSGTTIALDGVGVG